MTFDPCSTPKLWFKRLVIFKSLQPIQIIRDIELHRGINIVFGKTSLDPNLLDTPLAMAGHSVGKTTFCRLLRYCLGERHFSTEKGEERFQACLPYSWVGAELELEGIPWTVLRSLGSLKNHSFAQKRISIQELASTIGNGSRDNNSNFSEFSEELNRLLPSTVNRPDITYKWEHLLGWLTRDQECRFRKFEVWRDTASNSGSPAFRKTKEHPIHLMRGILDLLIPEEAQYNLTLAELLEQQTNLKQQQDEFQNKQIEAKREADILYLNAKTRLSEIIGEFQDNRDSSTPNLFGFDMLAASHKEKLNKEYMELKDQLKEINQSIFQAQHTLANAEERKQQLDAMLAATPPKEATNTGTGKKDYTEKKEKLEILSASIAAGGQCKLIVPFFLADCIHLADHIEYLRKAEKIINLPSEQQKAALDKMEKQQSENIQAIIKQQELAKTELDEAMTRQREYEAKQKDIQRKIALLEIKSDRLARALKELQNIDNISSDSESAANIQPLLESLEKIESEINETKQQMAAFQNQIATKDAALKTLFDEIVRRVLKDGHSGSVITSADGFMPQIIRKGNVIEGTTGEIFSFVLMDIASMLAPSKGIGHHPGFLLHDSPREADLDIGVYHSIFTELAAIAEESGGIDQAPFQYIVTTTTKPPASLDDLIRLTLAAYPESEMLLKQILSVSSLLDDN